MVIFENLDVDYGGIFLSFEQFECLHLKEFVSIT